MGASQTGNGNGFFTWKYMLVCLLFGGASVGSYHVGGMGNEEMERRIVSNTEAIEQNRRAIQNLALGVAELSSDVSNLHAKISDWIEQSRQERQRLHEQIERLEDRILSKLEK